MFLWRIPPEYHCTAVLFSGLGPHLVCPLLLCRREGPFGSVRAVVAARSYRPDHTSGASGQSQGNAPGWANGRSLTALTEGQIPHAQKAEQLYNCSALVINFSGSQGKKPPEATISTTESSGLSHPLRGHCRPRGFRSIFDTAVAKSCMQPKQL